MSTKAKAKKTPSRRYFVPEHGVSVQSTGYAASLEAAKRKTKNNVTTNEEGDVNR